MRPFPLPPCGPCREDRARTPVSDQATSPHLDPERDGVDVMVESRREILKERVPIGGGALAVTHERSLVELAFPVRRSFRRRDEDPVARESLEERPGLAEVGR